MRLVVRLVGTYSATMTLRNDYTRSEGEILKGWYRPRLKVSSNNDSLDHRMFVLFCLRFVFFTLPRISSISPTTRPRTRCLRANHQDLLLPSPGHPVCNGIVNLEVRRPPSLIGRTGVREGDMPIATHVKRQLPQACSLQQQSGD
jgi:hypothetical protein